jgi:sulfatase maturation enzyme AslB (radical SAM superfamily)
MSLIQVNNKMNTTCPALFYGIELNKFSVKPCCLFEKSFSSLTEFQEQIVDFQLQSTNGVAITECDRCWVQERNGKESLRQTKMKYFDNKPEELSEYQQALKKFNVKEKNEKFIFVDIKIGNLCNLQCKTCSSNNSTKWRKIEIENLGFTFQPNVISFNDAEMNEILAFLKEAKNIGVLTFHGGEPMIDKNVAEIISIIDSSPELQISEIVLITNGTIRPNNELLQKIKRLNIKLQISLDGVGEAFERMRYPAKFPKVVKNINYFLKSGITIGFTYTLSSLNSDDIFDFLNWYKEWYLELNISLFINLVLEPKEMSIFLMRDEDKTLFSDRITAFLDDNVNVDFGSVYDDLVSLINILEVKTHAAI